MTTASSIGVSLPRPDGWAKVAGSARYADDFQLPGMLWGATVRSPHAHARVTKITWHPDRAPESATCVTAADLPGPNGVQLLDDTWPILAEDFVRHVGEPVAIVAASSPEAALEAAQAVEVGYEVLDPILDLSESTEVFSAIELDNGGVDEALSEADVVTSGEYATGYQEHIYIECQAMTAWIEDDGTATVVGTMQCPYYVHKSMVHALGLPPEKVRIKASAVGGGFGGKEDFPSAIALHATLLAKKAGAPVRLVYDRHEDIVATTKRHPAQIRITTGTRRDGTFVAADIEVLMDGGAYNTLSPVVLSRALLHSWGAYRWPKVRVRARALATNTAPNGAFRGFGAPQTMFAIERQVDRIARSLDLDPYEIRLRNVLEPGDLLPTGQILDASSAGRRCLERAAERTDFQRRWRELEAERHAGPNRRGGGDDGETMSGIGLALFFHGAGFTGNGERRMKSPVTVRLTDEGRVEVLTAMTDMGQGAAAVFPQIAAQAGGLAFDDLVFAEPDTGRVPDSGPTVASRTTMVVGGTIAKAVAELCRQVEAWWTKSRADNSDGSKASPADSSDDFPGAGGFRAAARRFLAASGPLEVTLRHEPPVDQNFDETTYMGDAYPTYSWGCDVAEVEVDPDTLAVQPTVVTSVCDVGRVIHPRLCAGQIEGGTLQAVGWALTEEIKVKNGRYLNDRLATYIIPTALDAPKLDIELLESPWDGGPFGAKGVGELPMDGGAPAVVQAIENATGLNVNEIPATPERLMELSEA